MRSVLQDIIVLRLLAGDDVLSLLANLYHRIAETVELFKSFRLSGLNQHAGLNRPGAGRRMEAEVLKKKTGQLEQRASDMIRNRRT